MLVSNFKPSDRCSEYITHQSYRLLLLLPANLFELALSSSTNLKPVSFQEYKYFKKTKHQSIFRTSSLTINWGSKYRLINYTRDQWIPIVSSLKLYKKSIKISLIGKRWHCGGSKRRSWRLSSKHVVLRVDHFLKQTCPTCPEPGSIHLEANCRNAKEKRKVE